MSNLDKFYTNDNILELCLNNFSTDEKLDLKKIRESFKEIKKDYLCNGDTYLVILNNLSIPNWYHIEIWKFYKIEDNRFIILEFSNKKLFDMNILLKALYPNNLQKENNTKISVNRYDYNLYNYYLFDNDSTIESILYRNSSSVYGYKLPTEFDIND